MRHPYFDVPNPVVMGHRGAAGEVPENTLRSFERALEQGARILESDVHASRDGTAVLIHDEQVDRTTDGRGHVTELTLDELRRLDAGYRFSPDRGRTFPYRGRGLRIPTLEEAFEALPGARFNLELKERTPGLVARVVETVARAGCEATTLLTAADDALMAELRAHLAHTRVSVAVGASAGDVLRFIQAARDGRPPPPEPMALQVPVRFAGGPLVTPEFVRHAHAHGLPVHAWVVNEPEEMRRLLDLGVDGLVTDFPALAAEVVAKRGSSAS